MTQLVLIAALLAASVLQAMLPTAVWTGLAPAPLMPSLVIYYALARPRMVMLEVALLAGLIEDSLGQTPLGTSSFCYCVAGLAVEHFRETVVVRQWTTHAMLGAVVNLGVTVVSFALLAKDRLVEPDLLHVVLRPLGAALLGAAVAPVVFAAVEFLDRTVGNVEAGEA